MKILVVEDNKDMQDFYLESLRHLVNNLIVLKAYTIEDAEKLFAKNTDIDLVIMDGCVPGDKINTLPLIVKIRETFKGPMIAASRESGYQKQLIAAGCDYGVDKLELPNKIIEILRP